MEPHQQLSDDHCRKITTVPEEGGDLPEEPELQEEGGDLPEEGGDLLEEGAELPEEGSGGELSGGAVLVQTGDRELLQLAEMPPPPPLYSPSV